MKAVLVCLLLLVARGSSSPQLTAEQLTSLIPASFPTQDLSRYTVRYLSPEALDSEACLQPQPPQTEAPNATVQSCRTIRYSLSGGNRTGRTFLNNSYLILVVTPGRYNYGNRGIELIGFSNIIIVKNPVETEEAAIFTCVGKSTRFNNIYFEDAENLAFLDLTFSYCGPTSFGISVNIANNVLFDGCTFRDNFSSGLYISNIDNAVIQNSVFENNSALSSYIVEADTELEAGFPVGGGLTILSANGVDWYTEITNCTFRENSAGINESNRKDADLRPLLYVPRGHGGGLHISLPATIRHKIVIKSCRFIANSAQLAGGAISVQFYLGSSSIPEDYTSLIDNTTSSSNNTIQIGDTIFEDNLSSEGGAICVNAFEAANHNRVIISESVFLSNNATTIGGALSLNIQDNLVAEETVFNNIPIIESSNFTDNSCSFGGSAISLTSNARIDQVTNHSLIINCTFTGNRANISGAVSSLRFPIWLQGSNIFKENEGGAITLMQSDLEISGSAWFERNSARDGGAIRIIEQSAVNLRADATDVIFLRNHATTEGGAINVISQPLVENLFSAQDYYYRPISLQEQDCLNAPNVSFIGNTAGLNGAAMYTTNRTICSIRSAASDQCTSPYPRCSLFRNNTVINNPVGRQDHNFATDPSSLSVTPSKERVAPGEFLSFTIYALDQSGNRQRAVWTSSTDEGFLFVEAEGSVHTDIIDVKDVQGIDYDAKCTEPYNEEIRELKTLTPLQHDFRLTHASTGSVVAVMFLNLTITCCNPGYTLNGTATCRLDPQYEDLAVRSDINKTYFYVKRDYYARLRNSSIMWSSLPVFAGNCTRQGNLTGCLFKYDDPDAQCADNRTGFLCGKCPDGKHVDLTLARCVVCESWHTVFIVAIVVAFAVMCALIMVFNIGVPNELRGFLFFFQVVGFIYDYIDDFITWEYDFSSVFGFTFYIPELCPYPGYDAPSTAAIGIVLPIVAVLMILLYVFAARFIKHLSNKNSFDGIWFLTFIIYKFVADTCFSILRCQKVQGLEHSEYVYYYDGNYKCFSGESKLYLFYTVVALILSAAVIVFPLIILIISFRRFKFTVNITDVLNKDLKESCRWWASFDIFRRLLFAVVALLFGFLRPSYSEMALFYTGIFIFLVFIFFQPYTSTKANLSETLVLLNLLVVCGLFLNTDRSTQEIIRPVAQTLLLIPFLIAVLYTSYLIATYCWKSLPRSLKVISSRLLHKLRVKMPMLKRKKADHALHQQHSIVRMSTLVENEEDDGELERTSPRTADYSQYREELIASIYNT